MTTAPWLSVVVPVFNGARYLAAALDSVLCQADAQVEILVSDDGSTDDSPRLIAQYAGQGRVVAMRGPGRGNWVANSNLAVTRSRGRFVTFLHQDDLWLPRRLEAIRHIVASHPERSLWIAPTHFIDSAGRRVGTWRLPFRPSSGSVEPMEFLEHLLVQNFLGMPAPVFPRAAFERAGGMDEDLWFTADWDLWLKLGTQSGVALSPHPTTAFRLHRESQTMTGAAAHDSMRTQIDLVRARYLPQISSAATRIAVDRAGRFSSEINGTLASLVAGHRPHWRRLAASFFGLGVHGLHRFLRDARLLERSHARIRVSLALTRA